MSDGTDGAIETRIHTSITPSLVLHAYTDRKF